MDFEEIGVLVIGAGRTGAAVSRVLSARGARVRLADEQPAPLQAAAAGSGGAQLDLRLGDDDPHMLDGIDLVIPSPGVPAKSPLLAQAVSRGLPVRSEIEVAAGLLNSPVVAITGTNGKSTTTMLTGGMLSASGRRTFVGGNLGTPLIEAVDQDWDVVVAEVSSFQLEWVEHFCPDVGVLLNVSPDHLDRHGSMHTYVALKARVFAAQTDSCVAVLNRDDGTVWSLRRDVGGLVLPIGRDDDGATRGVFAGREGVICRDAAGETTFSTTSMRQRGRIHLENVMAAVGVARWFEVPQLTIQSVLDSFAGLPHRCEVVGEAEGVRYVDDSKATNVGAVVNSINEFSEPLVLIAGGFDKNADFAALRPAVRGRVRHVVAYGAARDRIAAALTGAVRVERVEGFADAVRAGKRLAARGEVVLLSPGCASFDQFANYAERGAAFRALVGRRLAAGGGTGGQ